MAAVAVLVVLLGGQAGLAQAAPVGRPGGAVPRTGTLQTVPAAPTPTVGIATEVDTVPPTIVVNDMSGSVGLRFSSGPIFIDDPTATTTVTGLPPGLAFDRSTSEISGTPTQPGFFTCEITSTDPAGNTATATFMFWVSDPSIRVVEPIDDITVRVGTPISLTVRVNDPNPMVGVSGLPDGVRAETSTWPVEIMGTPTTPGVYAVVVSAHGAYGNAGETSFTITVTPRLEVRAPRRTPASWLTPRPSRRTPHLHR